MNLHMHSRRVARESGSNFYFSFFFLPKQKREGLFSVYAFSRLVDDAVDEAADEEEARREIGLWRERLRSCYGNLGNPADPHPILPELVSTIRRFEIPEKYFEDLLRGVEMDLVKKRYETFSELETYCYHVAGTVGLLCNRIFGLKDPRGEEYAVLLGTAFQLTNILRDVGPDWRRGRIYLPREDLRRFGLDEEAIPAEASPAFLEMLRFEAARAESYFDRARSVLPFSVRKKILPSEIMTAFYRRILEKLKEENFPVLQKKIALSGWEKFYLIAKIFYATFAGGGL